MLEGNAKRLRHEHNQRAWMAWHTATIPMARKVPRLAELMILDRPKKQSIDQMRAIAKSWVRAFDKKR